MDGGQGVLELVFSQIDRLSIFNLRVTGSNWELVYLRFIQMPAPNLEFINIFPEDMFIAGPLTHPLFDNHAPNLNLQSLILYRLTVDITSSVSHRTPC